MQKQRINGERFRSSPSQLDVKPAISAGFSFIRTYGDKLGDMGRKYKIPTLHTEGKKWYVEYYYRIPDPLRPVYQNKVWLRFKVYEDINRIKTKEYAQTLRTIVEETLKRGYDPFVEQLQAQQEVKAGISRKKEWTILQALHFFKQKWGDRGLQPNSLAKYYRVADRFRDWLTKTGLQHTPAADIGQDHIEAELSFYKNSLKWSNRSYNNEREFLGTIFTFLDRKKLNTNKPHLEIAKLKSASKKHRFYDDRLLPKVKAALLQVDGNLAFAAECVYFLCIRSDKELKNFKIGNIFPERKQAFITAGGSKTNVDRYIPMTDELIAKLRSRGIMDLNPNWYVFGTDGKPGPKMMGTHWAAKKFREVRKRCDLSTDYTLMGFRHTRVIHLKKDGAKDDEIMAVTGHSDFVSYSKYLRDLGVDVDIEAIQNKSRKW